MEVLSAVVTKIAELLVAPIGQWLCYSFDYDNNIKIMEDKLQTLQSRRDSVQRSVDSAGRNGEEIEACVTRWLTKADETIEEARKIVPVQERAHPRWSNGACLKLKLRHQLSRKAKKIVQVIDKVLENGKFDIVSYRPAPQGEVSRRQMDYVDFGSRMLVAQGLMEALGDANTNMIGVWGMAGVGKTTLMREVARQAKEKELFDEVVMADVTESPNVRQIQGEIADMLDLKLDAETEKGRADRLIQRLTKQEKTEHKKTLVILDDIWKKLDLEKIGIPSTKCKVVLTSRDKDLLSCQMGTHKDFRLEELPQNEAWNLFEMTAGDCVKNPYLRCIATEVANECAGLPIALVTVSKALKNKSLNVWTDALQQLRRPVPGQIIRMQYATIYSSIELSYSHLESPEVKTFFLRCAEMHDSINCRDLLKYCYGLSLFEDIDNLEQARDRLYALVQHLKDKSLLLDHSHSSEHCRMHDVVGYVARFIASRDHNMFVVSDNSGLKKWTDVESLKRCSSFSIFGGDIHELPNEMECPNLRLLCVFGGDQSLQIPDTFFKRMGKLQVLDLTKMKLPLLPSSLSLLTNLQALCLDHCVLGDIAVIGELKNLVILSLSSSELSQLPKEIGLLTRLQLLDLSHCSKLEVIPPKVLSSLVELEELYMRNCFVQWGIEGLNSERNNASLAELHLSQLITLEIHITDVKNLPKDILFEKLKRYAISVGDHVWDSSNKREASRTLKLKLNTSFQSEVGIKMLLKSVEDLYLDELKGVKSLLSELDTEDFQQLKHLHIQNNPEIKYITNLRMPDVAFPALETFLLKNMISLEEICHDQLPSTISFRNLRIVKVEQCNKLKFIFSSSMASGLEKLQELEVRDCSFMGAIVMKDGSEIEDKDTSLFPKLRHLALEHLPKLISFLSTQNPLITDAGEIISEGELHFHMPILHEQVVFPILEKLELSSVNLVEIEQNQHPERSYCILRNTQAMSRFENLLCLKVKGNGDIKYILSFSMARFMVQLKHLHVKECEVMEEILVIEELGVKEKITPEVLFPRLECLHLKDLPILKRFCLGSNIEFSSLKTLKITNCPKVETFISKPLSSNMTINKELKEISTEETHSVMQPFFNEEVVFPILKRLELSSVNLVEIEQNQHPETSSCILRNTQATSRFENLLYLTVQGIGNIKYILSFSMARFMVQLKFFQVIKCEVMEEIIFTEESGVKEKRTPEVLFPQLERLGLEDLPILKRFSLGSNIEFPSLKALMIVNCPKVETFISKPLSSDMTTKKELKEMSADKTPHSVMQPFFNEEVVFPVLERTLINSSVKVLVDTQHLARSSSTLRNTQATSRFENLLFMEVHGMGNIKYMLSFSTARFMVQLKHFQVTECEVMEEIIFAEESGVKEEITPELVFHQLESLVLKDLPILKRFSLGRNIKFPSLKTLAIVNCPKVETFISKPLSSNTTIKEELKKMSAKKTPHSVMQPFFNEEVVFPILEILELSSVNLVEMEQNQHPERSYCILRNTQATSRFENLSCLKVQGISNIKYISSIFVARFMVQLKFLQVIECEVMEEIIFAEESGVKEEITPEVLFPRLECLHLNDLPILKRFCLGRNIEFPSLKILGIVNCPKVETFISKPLSSDMTIKKELKEISAEETSHSVMQPFFNEEVVFPILEMLELSSVNLVEIEHNQHPERSSCILRNTHAMSRFENLLYLEVRGIGNIKYISSFSMARFMVQLKFLQVMECEVMEEILVMEELGVKEEITPEVLFPRLECLHLKDLPILKRFCLGSNIEFPSLKTLKIANCPKVESFISKPLSSDMTINKELKEISAEETPHSVMQPFFNEKATFPKLERLLLANCHTIWRGQFLEECFCKLKVLQLLCNHNEADVSPPNFVKRLHNLEELDVYHSYFEEIFPYEELLDQEKHVGILAQLRVLKLSRHPKLTHLWNEDTQPCPIFHNLEILEVSKCGKLKMLAPSSVSFQNLSELEILKCHGLISLVTSSTAKSLVQLKKMSVSECKRITEIVRGDGGEGNDQVISFNKLTSLKLDCLPQLSNFCSGGYSFEFPSLEEVIVSQCQEMKIFSVGVLSTPKLKRVQATKEDEGHWKDDLNATIHWLWESKLCIPPSNDCSEKEVQDSEEDEFLECGSSMFIKN